MSLGVGLHTTACVAACCVWRALPAGMKPIACKDCPHAACSLPMICAINLQDARLLHEQTRKVAARARAVLAASQSTSRRPAHASTRRPLSARPDAGSSEAIGTVAADPARRPASAAAPSFDDRPGRDPKYLIELEDDIEQLRQGGQVRSSMWLRHCPKLSSYHLRACGS